MFNSPEKPITSQKIAIFDLDDTLIKYLKDIHFEHSSFTSHFDEIQLRYVSVPAKLREFEEHGYSIVIMTNQGGVSRNRISVSRMKVQDVVARFVLEKDGKCL